MSGYLLCDNIVFATALHYWKIPITLIAQFPYLWNVFFYSLYLTAATSSMMAQVAQRFDLKPNGFVDAKDSTKNYVVLEYPKMSKVDLYKKTLTYLNGLYKNPAAAISIVDGKGVPFIIYFGIFL
jgi:hypothetical protein